MQQIFYAAQSALGYEVGKAAHGMANNSMTPTQRETLSPSDPEYHLRFVHSATWFKTAFRLIRDFDLLYRVTGSKLQVAGWAIYAALIWSLKLSMLSFYIRLTVGVLRALVDLG